MAARVQIPPPALDHSNLKFSATLKIVLRSKQEYEEIYDLVERSIIAVEESIKSQKSPEEFSNLVHDLRSEIFSIGKVMLRKWVDIYNDVKLEDCIEFLKKTRPNDKELSEKLRYSEILVELANYLKLIRGGYKNDEMKVVKYFIKELYNLRSRYVEIFKLDQSNRIYQKRI